jgi:hypothetical protein
MSGRMVVLGSSSERVRCSRCANRVTTRRRELRRAIGPSFGLVLMEPPYRCLPGTRTLKTRTTISASSKGTAARATQACITTVARLKEMK